MIQCCIVVSFVLIVYIAEKFGLALGLASNPQAIVIKFTEVVLVTCCALFLARKGPWRQIEQRLFAPRIFILLPSVVLAYNIIGFILRNPNFQIDRSSALAALAVVFCIGGAEEITFRQIAYRNLVRISPAFYLCVNTATFGAIHFITNGWFGVFCGLVGGVVLDLARLAGARLWLLIIVHASIDVTGIISGEQGKPAIGTNGYWQFDPADVILLAMCVVSFLFVTLQPRYWRGSPISPHSPLSILPA